MSNKIPEGQTRSPEEHIVIDAKCSRCDETVKGEMVGDQDPRFADYFGIYALLGYSCPACKTVSCTKNNCKLHLLNIRFGQSNEGFKCSECGVSDVSPMIVFSEDAEIIPADTAQSEKYELLGAVMGFTVAFTFVMVFGMPLMDGRIAILRWLGDGGFIVVIGAIVGGILTAKQTARHMEARYKDKLLCY